MACTKYCCDLFAIIWVITNHNLEMSQVVNETLSWGLFLAMVKFTSAEDCVLHFCYQYVLLKFWNISGSFIDMEIL